MATLFFVCMFVGVGFVVLSLIFGSIGGDGADFDSAGDSGVSPFTPLVGSIFLTAFGGVGLFALPIFDIWIAFIAAGFGGLGLAFLMFRIAIVPLHRWQNTSAHDRQSLIGHPAKVAENIPQGGYGKITYTFDDKILSGPAKSDNGNEIKRGEAVEIIYIEKNTYHVRKK